eukprot:9508741-Ditylum_brightwellii.AAC.1
MASTVMAIYQKHQIALPRLLNAHNLYILKKLGVYKIHCLRTLHKLEYEVNLMQCEIIARCLMQNGERYKHFDDSQHGGHNGCNAVDIGLGKAFTIDTFHLQRANTGCTNHNAKA